MIYEARERGFTPEEQASLAGLAEALRELLGDEELEPEVDQPAA